MIRITMMMKITMMRMRIMMMMMLELNYNSDDNDDNGDDDTYALASDKEDSLQSPSPMSCKINDETTLDCKPPKVRL